VLTVYLSIFCNPYLLSGSSHEPAITTGVMTAGVTGRVRRKFLLLGSPQRESTLTSWLEDT